MELFRKATIEFFTIKHPPHCPVCLVLIPVYGWVYLDIQWLQYSPQGSDRVLEIASCPGQSN